MMTQMPRISVQSTVDEVAEYINNLKLDNFAFKDVVRRFRKEGIDGKALLNIEKARLIRLGLPQYLRRSSLYDHIEELRKGCIANVYGDPPSLNYEMSSLNCSFDSDLMRNINEIIQSEDSLSYLPQIEKEQTPILSQQIQNVCTISPRTSFEAMQPLQLNQPMSHWNVPPSEWSVPPQSALSPTAHEFIPSYEMPPQSHTDVAAPAPAPAPAPKEFVNKKTHKIKHKKRRRSSQTQTAPITENCIFQCKRISQNEVKFIAVIMSVNVEKQIFLLMSRRNVADFNDCAKRWSNNTNIVESLNAEYNLTADGSTDLTSVLSTLDFETKEVTTFSKVVPVKQCLENAEQQIFCSLVRISKCKSGNKLIGWNVNGSQIPFYSMCVVTFDFFRNAITSLAPMSCDGYVNNVTPRGLQWVTCALKVEVSDKYGSITGVKCADNRRGQFDRTASYLIHDWTYSKRNLRVGDKVKTCIKFASARRSEKSGGKKTIWVQAWNVRSA